MPHETLRVSCQERGNHKTSLQQWLAAKLMWGQVGPPFLLVSLPGGVRYVQVPTALAISIWTDVCKCNILGPTAREYV